VLIFYSYVSLPEGIGQWGFNLHIMMCFFNQLAWQDAEKPRPQNPLICLGVQLFHFP